MPPKPSEDGSTNPATMDYDVQITELKRSISTLEKESQNEKSSLKTTIDQVNKNNETLNTLINNIVNALPKVSANTRNDKPPKWNRPTDVTYVDTTSPSGNEGSSGEESSSADSASSGEEGSSADVVINATLTSTEENSDLASFTSDDDLESGTEYGSSYE